MFNMHTVQLRTRSFLLTVMAILIISVVIPTTHIHAQNYSFGVPKLALQVFVQEDASIRIVYDITFANNPGAHEIDIVDIGTPTNNYNIATMTASINGKPLTTIRPSEMIDTGVEIHLGDNAIAGGKRGTLHVEFPIPNMVYQDTTNQALASLQITPTWFDKNLVTGSSDIQIGIHLLPGVQPDEVLYQEHPFINKALVSDGNSGTDHVVAFWQWETGTATQAYKVGVSFPKRGMSRVVTMSIFALAVKWLDNSPTARFIVMALITIAVGYTYFRFTGGTGIALFLVIGAILFFCVFSSSALLLILFPFTMLIVPINEWLLTTRKKTYLPAIAQVEGGGIKRGLSAVESAILLEQPLNKVMMLLIYGLLKKGILTQTKEKPLTVVTDERFATTHTTKMDKTSRHNELTKQARELGVPLHEYEIPFMLLIEQHKASIATIDFSKPMKELIMHVANRMKGFDVSDTQDYYRRIVQRALEEAQQIDDIPEREKKLDRNLEWILLNDEFGTVFDSPGYRYRPRWSRSLPTSGGGGGSVGSSGNAPTPSDSPSFGDVSASMAGWMENTMGSFADAISPLATQVEKASGGFIDLRGIDKVTGDILTAIAESSAKSGGSGGKGCACACAGCACACACAGGGR